MSHSPAIGVTARVARRIMIAVAILGLVSLSVGVGFSLVQRADASPYDVCASGCPYTTIQDAINAATGPATITVGPGTYTPASSSVSVVTFNKSINLVGPNHDVNGASGARGPEAILDEQGGGAATVDITSPNVIINGFEITGATKATGSVSSSAGITGPSGADNAVVEDNIITKNFNGIGELDGSNVEIYQNLIRDNSSAPFGTSCFHGNPYCNGIFIGGSVPILTIIYNTIDESTTTPATIFNNFQRAASINPISSVDLAMEHNTILNSVTLGACDLIAPPSTCDPSVTMSGDFSHNTVEGGDFGVRLVGGVGFANRFAITDNTFTDLYSNAVISQDSFNSAGNSNLTMAGNIADYDVTLMQPFWVLNSTDVAAFDIDQLTGLNIFDQNTVAFTGGAVGAGVTSIEAAHVRSGMTGTLDMNTNVLDGGFTTGATTSGIVLDAGSHAPIGNVNANIIRAFNNGVNDTSNATYILGNNNCISGNSAYGYTASGGSVNAQNNWWGSAAGPGVGVGFGNPVTTTTVDASSFLTSAPQATCAGPVTSNVQSNVSPLPVNTAYTLSATVDSTSTSNAPIASAYYTLDGGAPQPMTTTSGTFGSSTQVNVTSGSLASFSSTGSHTLCVFGIDTYNQTGDPTCITLQVIIPTVNTTPTITSSANPSSFNQSVTFSITVVATSGIPTGTVSLTDNGNPLAGPLTLNGAGVATYTTSALSVGTHPLVAQYSGDSSGNPIYSPSTSATYNQVVNLIATTTSVSASPNPSVSGQTVTLSVSVHAADGSTPTGSVTLTDGATTLGTVTLTNGAGTFTTSSLSVGTHNITAAYGGDSTHATSSGTGAATVTATPAAPTGNNNAYVRIAQSSEAYATSDVSIDGAVTFPNIAACTVQPYFPISAGTHSFSVLAPSGGASVITQSIALTAGHYYTLAVVGNSAKSVTPAIIVFDDDNSVTTNQAKVRVYQLSDTLGAVEVKSGSTVEDASLAYQQATGYITQSAGTVTYSFQPSSGPAINDTLNVAANQVYSVFLMCNGQASNAAATGIPASLPQTGNGPVGLLTPLEVKLLEIIGVILLLAGAAGLGAYLIVSRRRNLAL